MQSNASATEGDSMTFTLTLGSRTGDAVSPGPFSVTPDFSGGTATKGTDYTANTAAIAFEGNHGEKQTLTVATTEDAVVEGDEYFSVTLTVSGTQETILSGVGTGTIVNDDAATVTIADASADEGDAITFTLTLDNAVAGGFTVEPSFTAGTATSGTDYTENTAEITFAGTAGETQTFSVATTEDSIVEPDETFTVSMTTTAANVTVTDTATGTITNDDTATVTIDADASAAEGDAITFTLRVNNAVAGGFSVLGNFTDGTATQGTDYTKSLGNANKIIFAGVANETHTASVATIEDSDAEGDETFTLGLSVHSISSTGLTPGSGIRRAAIVTTDTATGTILDDDGPPTLTIADAAADEGDAITFTVTLSKEVSGGLTVTPSFTDGTATKGTDYTENTAGISFTGTAGEAQTFTVATTEDAAVEADETFTVGLTVTGTSVTITATDTATGTIRNDDDAPPPALTIADAAADEGDAIRFTVTLSKEVSGGLTVTPSFTDGTATKGTDYTENTAGISFTGTAGETQTFTVATTEDAAVEPDETFTVSLTVTGTSETITATDTATGTIRNDDTAPPVDDDDDDTAQGTTDDDDNDAPDVGDDNDAPDVGDDTAPAVNLSVSPSSVNEGASGTAVTVTASFSTGKTFTSNRTVTVSVGGGTATSGTDYVAVSRFAITIPAGATSGTGRFTLRPIQDTTVEGNETVDVAGRAGNLTVNGTRLTLTDDDGAPAVNLSVSPSSVSEGAASTSVTVTAAFSNSSTFTTDTAVSVSVAGGTATSGTDYAAVSDFDITIAKGATSGTGRFTLTPAEDAQVEAAETIRVAGGASGLTVNGTRLTLTDATPRLGVSAARAAEGETMVFTVTLQSASPRAVTVQYATVDGSAAAGADYTSTSGQLVFSADETEQRVSVPITDDAEVEDNETFTLALQLTDALGSPASATGTIVDNDVVTFTVIEPDVRETDGLATFTVSHSSASAYQIVVAYGTSDGTATAGADYVETTGELVFAPGETEQAIDVQVMDDDLVESTETLLLSMTVVSVGSRAFGSSGVKPPPIRLAQSDATDQGSPTSLQTTGTIRDDELAQTRGSGTSRTLYLLARSMASEAVAAIGERFVATGGDDTPRATLGAAPPAGQGVAGADAGVAYPAVSSSGGMGASPGAGQGTMALHRASDEPFADLGWLDNANFSVPVGQANQAGRWQVWGRAGTVRSRLQTRTGGHARGDVFSSHMGVDTRLGDAALLGVSLSHTVGLLGYTVQNPLVEGALPGEGDGRVTSVQPYAHWAPRDGLTLWGMGGGGLGSLTLTDSVGMVETPLGLRLFAGGARQALATGLALKADAFHATLRAAEHADMAAAVGTAMRGRMLAEGQTDWALSESSSLNPRLEAGLRWDGGTDVEGLGAEMGVGLAYVNRRLNLGLETQGRYLVAHQANGFEEWGAGLSLRVGPGIDRPGPWLALNPEWGAPDSRVAALWDPRAAPEMHRGVAGAPGARPDRIAATAGYRLSEAKSVSLEALHETRPGDGGGVAARVTGNLQWGGGTDGEPPPPADSRFRRGESAAAGDATHAGRPAPVRLDAVAVAAFHNLSGAPADDWLGAGVKETLTNALEDLAAISVVGNGEAGGAAPAWLVAGEYQRRGDRLQIDARVVDTRSGAVAARSRAGGVAAELFELQDRIAADLAGALGNLSAGGGAGGREPVARELPRRRLDERGPEGGDAATAPQRALARRPIGSRDAGIVDVRRSAVRLDTVAIDQFHNVSRVPADDWLGAGVTETLTSALEQLDAVEVVRNPGGSGPAAAWVVDGEYRRRGDRLQIDTRVVDTRRGAVAARSSVEGAAAEIFELQDRITADLADVLGNLSTGGGTGYRALETPERPRRRLAEAGREPARIPADASPRRLSAALDW
ncbi:MAG: hypothetical protein OXG04_12815 [Acidobacteria bacterium]|nr:hypothetical protein [Acidobacteriota bacterium]